MGSLNTIITKEEWQCQWKGCCKSTSSLESSLPFDHYISGICSSHVSYFHVLKATPILQQDVVLGLLEMLEKMFECALITKLRSMLLM
jgi:hypothetical protein